MNQFGLTWFSHKFDFPSKQEPSWKNKIERWYQLDACAYGMVDAAIHWDLKLEPTDIVLAASPGASNIADYDFVNTGATSAAKFVHTLPNIRMSPFCEALNWSGKVLCIQSDPGTLSSALLEASLMLSPKHPTVWIFSIFPGCPYTAHGLKLSLTNSICSTRFAYGKWSLKQIELFADFQINLNSNSARQISNDFDLIHWFESGTEKFKLTEGLTLFRGAQLGADNR